MNPLPGSYQGFMAEVAATQRWLSVSTLHDIDRGELAKFGSLLERLRPEDRAKPVLFLTSLLDLPDSSRMDIPRHKDVADVPSRVFDNEGMIRVMIGKFLPSLPPGEDRFEVVVRRYEQANRHIPLGRLRTIPEPLISFLSPSPTSRDKAVAILNDPKAKKTDKETAVAAFALSYGGLLSFGAVQLLERKGGRWLLGDDSEILEAGLDFSLIRAWEKEPAEVGNRLRYLAETWLAEERDRRGDPVLSAFLRDRKGSHDRRLGPSRHPLIARHLIREILQERAAEPSSLELNVSSDTTDGLIEGLLVFLTFIPTASSAEGALSVTDPREQEHHRMTHRLPAEQESPEEPYRGANPPPPIDESRLQVSRLAKLDHPLPDRWISLPPHKILTIDKERRGIKIHIAAKEEEYELVWHPSETDWKAMVGRSLWKRSLRLNRQEFYERFGKAYRRHEEIRPLEKTLEASWRTLRIFMGANRRSDASARLARSLRDDLYDLVYRHGLGGDFLKELSGNADLMKDVREMVARWLPRLDAETHTTGDNLLFAMAAGKGFKGPRTSGAPPGGGPYRVDGRPDPASSLKGEILSRHPNGKGWEVRLLEDQNVVGDFFPKGSTLVFDEGGRLREALLPRKQTIRGFPCAALGPVVLEKDRAGITRDRKTSILFHENGRLRAIGLEEKCTIEDISLKAGTIVYFREDGRLQNLFLETAQKIRGLLLPRQTSISFHENGVIASLHFIPPPKRIKGLPDFSGSFISFDENGKVRRGK